MRSTPPTTRTASPGELTDISKASTALAMIASPPHDPVLLNELRIRVLEGEDISAEEMLLIVNDIRRDRRAAARPERAAPAPRGRAKAPQVQAPPENLRALIDQDLI